MSNLSAGQRLEATLCGAGNGRGFDFLSFSFLFIYLFVSKSTVNTAINHADVKQLQIEALFHVICTTILLHSQLFTVCK